MEILDPESVARELWNQIHEEIEDCEDNYDEEGNLRRRNLFACNLLKKRYRKNPKLFNNQKNFTKCDSKGRGNLNDKFHSAGN